MDVIEAIMTRRCVRNFLPDPVPEEMINTLLRSAMQAPSAVNEQPWHFVVVTDRSLLKEMTTFHTSTQVLNTAPLGILVCADQRLLKRDNCWYQDCSAATMNMLLAAHSLGLGAVWLGIHHLEERVNGVVRLFHLPPELLPFSMVAAGFAAKKPEPEDRFIPDRVHHNFFGSV